MKIVYIAGPLTTGWDFKDISYIKEKIHAAEAYQVALANDGIGAFCPHAHTQFQGEKGSIAPESYYYELDLQFLYRADAVLAMPGWEKSVGAKIEVEWAKENNLPIFYPKSPDDIGDIIDWNNK